MIIGVIGFYFVVSNINSIISNTIKINMNFTAKISLLDKLQAKYKLNQRFYRMIRKSLIKEDYKRDVESFKPMFRKFPKYLRRELKYQMYLKVFGNFKILLKLDKNVLNKIGDCSAKLHFQKSGPDQIKPFTRRTTPPRRSTSSKRATS